MWGHVSTKQLDDFRPISSSFISRENASLTNQTVEEPNSAPTATTEVPKPESSTESPTTEASRSDDSNSKNATGNQERIELNPSADSNSSKENKAKTNEK